jgi:uncharacterized protein YeeX (DUF496 family)
MRDDKGRFAEGNTGRPKGSVNKSSNEIRETFQLLLENNLEKLQEDLNELEPKDRVKLLLNLSNYILPKLRSIDLQSDIEETITIDFNESVGWNKTEDQEEN